MLGAAFGRGASGAAFGCTLLVLPFEVCASGAACGRVAVGAASWMCASGVAFGRVLLAPRFRRPPRRPCRDTCDRDPTCFMINRSTLKGPRATSIPVQLPLHNHFPPAACSCLSIFEPEFSNDIAVHVSTRYYLCSRRTEIALLRQLPFEVLTRHGIRISGFSM